MIAIQPKEVAQNQKIQIWLEMHQVKIKNQQQDVYFSNNNEIWTKKNLALVDTNTISELEELEESLINTFGNNYENIIVKNNNSTAMAENLEKSFDKNEFNQTIYPDNFGGMYINQNVIQQLIQLIVIIQHQHCPWNI